MRDELTDLPDNHVAAGVEDDHDDGLKVVHRQDEHRAAHAEQQVVDGDDGICVLPYHEMGQSLEAVGVVAVDSNLVLFNVKIR